MNSEQVFEAYCDSSGLFAESFQSIGIMSGNRDSIDELREELREILGDKEISEIKPLYDLVLKISQFIIKQLIPKYTHEKADIPIFLQ